MRAVWLRTAGIAGLLVGGACGGEDVESLRADGEPSVSIGDAQSEPTLAASVECPTNDDRIVSGEGDFDPESVGEPSPRAALERLRQLQFRGIESFGEDEVSTRSLSSDRVLLEAEVDGSIRVAAIADRLANGTWLISEMAICSADLVPTERSSGATDWS